MAVRHWFTTAPADYDYRACTTELLAQVLDNRGNAYRLVEIRDNEGGTFHRGQVPRYQSGLHACWEAGSEDAASLELVSGAAALLGVEAKDDALLAILYYLEKEAERPSEVGEG